MTPEVWIALFGLIGTLGAGLGANLLNNRAARQRENLQWQREIGEKRRLERLDAFEEYASLTMTVVLTGEHFNSEELLRSLHRVEMRFSPSTGALAFELHGNSINVLQEGQKPEAKKDKQEEERLIQEWAEVRRRFIEHARKEIASPESLTNPTPHN